MEEERPTWRRRGRYGGGEADKLFLCLITQPITL
jgi:hypothetical protein